MARQNEPRKTIPSGHRSRKGQATGSTFSLLTSESPKDHLSTGGHLQEVPFKSIKQIDHWPSDSKELLWNHPLKHSDKARKARQDDRFWSKQTRLRNEHGGGLK